MKLLVRAGQLALACTLIGAMLVLCVSDARAQAAPPPPVASVYENIIAPLDPATGRKELCAKINGVFVEKVVDCLLSPTVGIIPKIIKAFIVAVKPYATAINGVVMLLVITLSSLKFMFTADIQHAGRDSWILLFKIGGVGYFTANADIIYLDVVSLMDGFLELISRGTTIATGVCTSKATLATPPSAWAIWDCMFMKLFGTGIISSLSSSSVTTTAATAGIIGWLGLNMLLNPASWVIFSVGLYLILKLMFTMARILHIYFIACVGIGFMFCIAFLFIPAIFFTEVKTYFDKWLRLIIGYVLTAMLLFAYMGFALSALDSVVVSGKYSLIRMVAGNTVADSNPVDDSTGKPITNPPATSTIGGTVASGASVTKAPLINGISANTSPNETPNMKAPVFVPGGVAGTVRGGKEVAQPGASARVYSDVTVLNVSESAKASGSGKTAGKYLYDIFVAIVVSALLVYILYSLLSYIPDMVTDIVLPGFQQGSIAKDRAIGEVLVKQSIGAVKDIIILAIAIKTGGAVGKKDALKAGMQLADRAQKVMRNDPKELRG